MNKWHVRAGAGFGLLFGNILVWFIDTRKAKHMKKTEAVTTSTEEYVPPQAVVSAYELGPEKANDHVVMNQYHVLANKYRPEVDVVADIPIPDTVSDSPRLLKDVDDFGSDLTYKQVFLNFYANGILTDLDDRRWTTQEILNNLPIGFASHFGESGEEDMVYVRNDRTKTEYGIQKLDDIYDSAAFGMEDEEDED